ncbi:ROK family transcriptional regulator [Actinocrinis puniceicyclus]|uniref:ROK family transcriptional regulator n=1 Tax=Actinocrinis puniceicyclus TaxID=977794 RepID=A0A8J7WPA5_9ACTN|nr:ROK family transcriptional regulator [Actinocrinis puniceicyclus]MBS2963792.1 ROK family transcriptional regulator [Actinocrinis puniceicyclus]
MSEESGAESALPARASRRAAARGGSTRSTQPRDGESGASARGPDEIPAADAADPGEQGSAGGLGRTDVARPQRSAGHRAAGPASQQGMRRQNLALVMNALAALGPSSRAEVAERTGLTRAAVGSLVNELAAAGLTTDLGLAPSGRVGRPGTALALSEHGPAGLGLEIGVERLGACVIDLHGTVRTWVETEAPNRSRAPREVLAELSDVAAAALQHAAAQGLHPVGTVVAVPGLVDAANGAVEQAPNLGWRAVPVAQSLGQWLPAPLRPVPIELENEANLGALAELWHAPARPPDFIHISAEAGIGAALVIDGRLFRGARGFAGELGHVPVHPEGPLCSCGARGCLEQYAGEETVLRASGLADAGGDRIRLLTDQALGGNPLVLEALEEAGRALGTALSGAVNLLDPSALVLGGAYAELGEWLLPQMRRELAARVTVRPWSPDALRLSQLGRRGPLLGAATVTIRRIIEDPARYADWRKARELAAAGR